MSDNANNIEVALKYQVKRQVGLKEQSYTANAYLQKQMISSWITMQNYITREQLHNIIWDFVDNSPFEIGILIPSHLINIYSTIKEDINKKGKKYLAHYSQHGNFLGLVSQMGSKPISFPTFVDVRRHKDLIGIDFKKLIDTTLLIKDLFRLKKDIQIHTPIDDEDDDMPLINLIKKHETKITKSETETESMTEESETTDTEPEIKTKKTKTKKIKKLKLMLVDDE
jgi:hypothetical protein